MASPYGIAQVDIPSLLGMHQQLKRQRLEDLYRAKEIERRDRADEKDLQFSGLLAKAFMRKPTEGASTPAAKPPESPPVAEAPTTPGVDTSIPSGSPLSPERFPEPSTPSVGGPAEPFNPPAASSAPQLDPEIFAQMVALNPEQAFKVSEYFAKMDETTRKAAEAKNKMIGSVAVRLRAIPAAERMAAMNDIAPQLIQAGVSPQELQGIDLGDRALDGRIALAMDAEKIIAGIRDDARFAETQRHNRVSEGNAAAGLGIRERALDLAGKRESRVAGGGAAGVGGMSDDALIAAAMGN